MSTRPLWRIRGLLADPTFQEENDRPAQQQDVMRCQMSTVYYFLKSERLLGCFQSVVLVAHEASSSHANTKRSDLVASPRRSGHDSADHLAVMFWPWAHQLSSRVRVAMLSRQWSDEHGRWHYSKPRGVYLLYMMGGGYKRRWTMVVQGSEVNTQARPTHFSSWRLLKSRRIDIK